MGSRTPTAPEGLDKRGKSLWKSIAGEYELRPDERRILEDACREADLIHELEEARKSDLELVVEGSMKQPVTNPVIVELRQHRSVLRQLLGSLKLGAGGGDGKRASAGSTSGSARKAAAARWQKRGA